jgi:hypothetical protein
MAREAIYHTARLRKDGTEYTIGDRKYRKEIDEWDIIATFDYSTGIRSNEITEQAAAKTIEEFTDTDLDLGQLEDDPEPELDYHALKDFLKAKGLEIKGNPKKDTLIEMYKEAIG